MAELRRNIELKARDRDPAGSLKSCKNLGAEEKRLLLQEDIYFDVPRGRLKLRREQGAVTHLIAYHRPDLADQKESRYRIVEIVDASGIEEALTSALGITAVVSKRRRLFLVNGVRIHLDSVDGLGSFIEFEAVTVQDTDLGRVESLLADLRRSFGIEDADLIAGSYCDLVLTGGSSN